GTVTFDSNHVDLVSITGRGPTGASLLAKGRIEPLDEHAGLDIEVTVTGVPTDDYLREAVPEYRRAAFETLFNLPAYQRLVEAGLVQPAARLAERRGRREEVARSLARARQGPERDGLERELADLDRAIAVPVFDLGGESTIGVHVTREHGAGHEYATEIRVSV